MSKLIDITGNRYGKLTVIRRAGTWRDKDGFGTAPKWLCKCDCGSEVVVIGRNLKTGATRSCGCIKKGGSMASTCKSCGAPIFWVRSHKAKWIPCDEGLKPYKQDETGKEFVVTQDGDVIRCTFDFEGFPTGMARTPHWATCPEADRWRKHESTT